MNRTKLANTLKQSSPEEIKNEIILLVDSLEEETEVDLIKFTSELYKDRSFDSLKIFVETLLQFKEKLNRETVYKLLKIYTLFALLTTERYEYTMSQWLWLGSETHHKDWNFLRARECFSNALLFSENIEGISKDQIIQKKLLSEKEFFTDLVRSTNMYYYLRSREKSVSYGWRSVYISLEIISQMIEHSQIDTKLIENIIEQLKIVTKALTEQNIEITKVIELKMEELLKFYESILNQTISNVDHELSVHKESIKYLIPASQPVFMFLTKDGRTFYQGTGRSDGESAQVVIGHLVGGVISVINTIFEEEYLFTGGRPEEIITEEKYIELFPSEAFIMVVFADYVFDDLYQFSLNLTQTIEEAYGENLKNWKGERAKIDDVIRTVETLIMNFMDK